MSFLGDGFLKMLDWKIDQYFQIKMNQQGMIISAWVNILEELVTFSLSKELSIIEPSHIGMFVMDIMSITTYHVTDLISE